MSIQQTHGGARTDAYGTDWTEAVLAKNPGIAEKLDDLHDQMNTAWSVMNSTWNRLKDLEEKKVRADVELAQLEDLLARGRLNRVTPGLADSTDKWGNIVERDGTPGTIEPDNARVEAAKAKARLAADRVARAKEAHAKAGDDYNASRRVYERCQDYVSQNRFSVAPPDEASPSKGETHVDAVARVRKLIAAVAEEAKATKRAPLPADELRRRAIAEVARLAESGAPQVLPNGKLRWPTRVPEGSVHGVVDPVAVIAWLMPEVISEAIGAAVAEQEQPAGAMTDAEREEKLAALAGRALSLGRQEEALIIAADAEGADIVRRADADPRAVLGVEGPAPKG